MTHILQLSRRAPIELGQVHRLRTPFCTPLAHSITLCRPGFAHVDPSLSALAGRDRTFEASTSQQQAAGSKAKRIPPTDLKPNMIEDIEILQNGVILVNKPLGWTSFDVCGKIRNMLKFLGIKKVGHAGTLDPNASGLLIVCTGRGTKFCNDFMAEDKEYSGTFRLGEGTASYDSESEVSERAAWGHITGAEYVKGPGAGRASSGCRTEPAVSDADIEAAASRFVGEIMQVPPIFSALKVGGKKLYQLAREGQSLELPARPVTITSLRVWRDEANRQDVHFYVACSKGTYIRSLAYDMGRALGSAAHLVALRREAVGVHRLEGAWDLRRLIEQIDVHRKTFLERQQQPQQQQEQQQLEAAADTGAGASAGVGAEAAGVEAAAEQLRDHQLKVIRGGDDPQPPGFPFPGFPAAPAPDTPSSCSGEGGACAAGPGPGAAWVPGGGGSHALGSSAAHVVRTVSCGSLLAGPWGSLSAAEREKFRCLGRSQLMDAWRHFLSEVAVPLLALETNPEDEAAAGQILQLATQATMFFKHASLLAPDTVMLVSQTHLESEAVCPPEPGHWHNVVLTLDLTAAQESELRAVFQLFSDIMRGVVAERRAINSRLAASNYPPVADLVALMEQLTVSPECEVMQNLMRSMRREKAAHMLLRGYLFGSTLTVLQFVKAAVYSYPWMVDATAIVGAVAELASIQQGQGQPAGTPGTST